MSAPGSAAWGDVVRAATELVRALTRYATASGLSLSGQTRPVAASGGQPGPEPLTGPLGAPDAALMPYDTVAEVLSVSDRTVRRIVADGLLPAVTVGGCKRVKRTDLDAYIDALESS